MNYFLNCHNQLLISKKIGKLKNNLIYAKPEKVLQERRFRDQTWLAA
jgi:hypothetical protein